MMSWEDEDESDSLEEVEDSPTLYHCRTYHPITEDFKLEQEPPEEKKSEKELVEKAKGSINSAGEETVCRYCLDPGGELIAPCVCKGGQKWVHLNCLRKWQRMVLVKKNTQPYFHEREPNRHEICNICKTKFLIKPMDWGDMVISLTGKDIVNRICEGFIIVRTMESSRQSLRILVANQHIPSVRHNLAPWIGGAYLVVGISAIPGKANDRGEDLICAINLTKEIVETERRWRTYIDHAVGSNRHVNIRHFDGGPCDGLHAVACLKFTAKESAEEAGLQIIDEKPYAVVVAGRFQTVVELADKDWIHENERRGDCSRPQPVIPDRQVLLAWGDGTWSRTQLIGEIARGGWGMCRFKANDVFKIPGEPDPPSPERLFRQLHRQNRVLAPGQNEMSRAMNESIDIRPFEQNDELARHREYLRSQLLSRNKKSEMDDSKMTSIGSSIGSTAPNSIASNNSISSEERKSNLPNIETRTHTMPVVSSRMTRSSPERGSSRGPGSNESEDEDQDSPAIPAGEHRVNHHMES